MPVTARLAAIFAGEMLDAGGLVERTYPEGAGIKCELAAMVVFMRLSPGAIDKIGVSSECLCFKFGLSGLLEESRAVPIPIFDADYGSPGIPFGATNFY